MEKLARLSLPPSKHRWLGTITHLNSSYSVIPDSKLSMLGGDRRGSLHLYQPTASDVETVHCPVQTLHGIHGPNGVTDSCVHDGYIYTCGRNGECRKFELSDDGKSLVELVRFKVRTVECTNKERHVVFFFFVYVCTYSWPIL